MGDKNKLTIVKEIVLSNSNIVTIIVITITFLSSRKVLHNEYQSYKSLGWPTFKLQYRREQYLMPCTEISNHLPTPYQQNENNACTMHKWWCQKTKKHSYKPIL